jgi:glycosyltransferase involved in cell wall biosynthesis
MSRSAPVPIHVFIDVSRCAHGAAVGEIEWLQRPDALGGLVERATVATPKPLDLPTGWAGAPGPATRMCERAFFDAACHSAHLLVVFDGARPTSEAIGGLAATLAVDPLFGVVHPRFSDAEGRRVLPSMAGSKTSRIDVAREVLATLPVFYVTTECLSPCFLIRRDLVANLTPTLEGWIDVRGLLAQYAVRARRLGFRTVIANRAVVRLDSPVADSAELHPDPKDVAVVRSAFPEVDRARGEFSRAEAFDEERLVSQFFDGPDRWLLDGRNLIASVNGTVKAALGICDGLYATRRERDTTLWVTAEATEYHGLENRYPGWQIVTSTPEDCFGVVFRLSQPWSLTEALDLHPLAPVNVFLMNDTIAWDAVYPAHRGLEATWRYVATYADAVLFISEFSRQRFQARFAVSPTVRSVVVHHSVDPADYTSDTTGSAPDEPYWLIIGNVYDHKYVKPTLDLMTRSFPRKRLVAFGDREPKRGPRVTQLESGPTEESRMQGLYSNAEIVIFPSFYEGFGLPLVNALAYGRTVVARDSALVREIGGAYRGPGRLVVYESETDLIGRLSRLSRGKPVPEIPLARSDGEPPFGWAQAGREIEAFITSIVGTVSPVQTRARAALVSLLGQAAPEASRVLTKPAV